VDWMARKPDFRASGARCPWVARAVACVGLGLAALMGGCGNDETQYGDVLPRVATFDGTSWTVEARDGDRFSTMNSIFGGRPGLNPVALTDEGGVITFGQWTGSDWEEERVGEIEGASENQQMYSGVMSVDEQGHPFALFVTTGWKLYFAGRPADQWIFQELSDREITCFDMDIGEDGLVRLLTADPRNSRTLVTTVHDDGTMEDLVIHDSAALCGRMSTKLVTIDENSEADASGDGSDGSRDGEGEASAGTTLGVVLLDVNTENYTSGVVTFYELPAGAAEYSIVELTNDARYECEYCDLPELVYRGDGRAVVSYITSAPAGVLATQQEDGTFDSYALTNGYQSFQWTRIKPGLDESAALLIVLDQETVALAVSYGNGYSYNAVASGSYATSPRLVWDGTRSAGAFWASDGLWGLVPSDGGGYSASLIDSKADLGYYLGSFVSIGADDHLQVFYNEWHEVE